MPDLELKATFFDEKGQKDFIWILWARDWARKIDSSPSVNPVQYEFKLIKPTLGNEDTGNGLDDDDGWRIAQSSMTLHFVCILWWASRVLFDFLIAGCMQAHVCSKWNIMFAHYTRACHAMIFAYCKESNLRAGILPLGIGSFLSTNKSIAWLVRL